jgi:hypothetical protein
MIGNQEAIISTESSVNLETSIPANLEDNSIDLEVKVRREPLNFICLDPKPFNHEERNYQNE